MFNLYSLIFLIVLFISILIITLLFLNANKKYIKSITSDVEDYKNKLNEQNKILLKDIIDQYDFDTGIKEVGHEKELFSIFLKLRESIKENCMITMNTIGASRLAIYLLHNGTYSTHGISFFKMSCICEKIAIGSGVRERMIEHTNIPINLFDDMIDKIVTNDRYIVMNDENISKSNHKIFISAEKIYYSQLVAIYDINNNVLGFVLAEMDHPYSKDIADKEKKHLDELTRQLVPVLSYSNYTNKTTK